MPSPYEFALFPGRHHLLTRFQAGYLRELLAGEVTDLSGDPVSFSPGAEVVWPVTSANHQNTRRNPVPANRREAAIELFSLQEGLRSLVVPVFDVPQTQRFAEVTIKAVAAATGGRVQITSDNTVVACSTPAVIEMYQALGFRITGVELDLPEQPPRPWDVLERLAAGDEAWRELAHPATVDVFDRYAFVELIRMITADPVVGAEGSLTDKRNYRTYGATFEKAAERKWTQARPFVRPGRIVDIGCATGGMLELAAADPELAAADPELAECDLFGIEVARHLYDECMHKKEQGVFANQNTFFYQRNILSGPVFPEGSIDTTLTFALTHEILSYGGGESAIRSFAESISRQTVEGGVWINSDVCGPDEPDREVVLRFAEPGLAVSPRELTQLSSEGVKDYIDSLTPAARFRQFAQDFAAGAGVSFEHEILDEGRVRLSLADAMEFMSHYRYSDNWLSETHERFCALSWAGWGRLVAGAGFEIDQRSRPWRNEWIVANTLKPVASLLDTADNALDWPVTHMLLVAERPAGSLEPPS